MDRHPQIHESQRVSDDTDSTIGGVSADSLLSDRAEGGNSAGVQGGEASGEAGADRE